MRTKFFLCVVAAATVFVVSLFSQRQSLPDEKGLLPEAERKLAADPKNIELLLALGKVQGDLWRFDDAITTYSRGMEWAPGNALLYLNRGHRYISTRRFDLALKDLEKAAGLDSGNSEVWYHIGLTHYMKGDFAKAAPAWERCRELAKTNDNLASSSDWLYMTYRRLKREEDAAQVLERITPEMKITGSPYYHQRLLFYKGLKKEEELFGKDLPDVGVATLQYGAGNWYLYNGNVQKAREYFERVVAGKAWAAFGFIAAEVELKRMK